MYNNSTLKTMDLKIKYNNQYQLKINLYKEVLNQISILRNMG